MSENLDKAVAGRGRIHLLIVPKYNILQQIVESLALALHKKGRKFVYLALLGRFEFPSGSVYQVSVVDSKQSIGRFLGYSLAGVEFHPTCAEFMAPPLYDLARQVLCSRVRDQSGVHPSSDAAQYTCNQLGESEFSMSTSHVSDIMPTPLLKLFSTTSHFKPLVHFAWWICKSHLADEFQQNAARITPETATYFKIWNSQLRQRYGYEVIENWAQRFVKGSAAKMYWGDDRKLTIRSSSRGVAIEFPSSYRTVTEQRYPKPNGGRRTLPAFYTSLNKYWVWSNGEIAPPDTMNQSHLQNTAKLLRESHSNIQGQCSELLGNMRAHFRNSPQVCAKIDALWGEMLTVPVEQMYPVLLTLMKHVGDTDPPAAYDPKDIAPLDVL